LEWVVCLALFPVLVLLVMSIADKIFSFHYRLLWLFLPFVLEFAQFFSYLFTPIEQKLQMIDLFYQNTRPGPVNLFSNPLLLVKRVLIPVVFLSYTLVNIFRARHAARGKLSPNLFNYLLWMIGLILAFRISAQILYYFFYSLTQHELVEKILDASLLTAVIILLCSLILNELGKN